MHATVIINYGKKKILLLSDKKIESYNNKKFCRICKEEFWWCSDDSDDNDDAEFDTRMFHSDAPRLVMMIDDWLLSLWC